MQPTQRFDCLLEQLSALLVTASEYVTSHKKQFLQSEQHLKNQVTTKNFLYAQLNEQPPNPTEEEDVWEQELIYLCRICDLEIDSCTQTFDSNHTKLLSSYALYDFIQLRIRDVNSKYYQHLEDLGKIAEDTELLSADSTTSVKETSATVDQNSVSSLVSTIH